MAEDKVMLSVRIRPELRRLLRVEAASDGVTVEALVERAIDEMFAREQGFQPGFSPQVEAALDLDQARDWMRAEADKLSLLTGREGSDPEGAGLSGEASPQTSSRSRPVSSARLGRESSDEEEPLVRGCLDHRGDPEDWCPACIAMEAT